MITIDSPLTQDAEYRTASDGNALVLLHLDGPVEARVVFTGGFEGHLAAEMTARRCKRGDAARVTGDVLSYRTDHGVATHVLRAVTLAVVAGRTLL